MYCSFQNKFKCFWSLAPWSYIGQCGWLPKVPHPGTLGTWVDVFPLKICRKLRPLYTGCLPRTIRGPSGSRWGWFLFRINAAWSYKAVVDFETFFSKGLTVCIISVLNNLSSNGKMREVRLNYRHCVLVLELQVIRPSVTLTVNCVQIL